MTARIDVWEEQPERWRWAYREADVEFLSNQLYGSRAEALAAARTAYPDLPTGEQHVGPARREPISAGAFVLGVLALWLEFRRSRRS
jgi:hypothetical protein